MKKPEKEEIPDLLPVSKGKTTLLRTMLLQLKMGEGLFLPLAD